MAQKITSRMLTVFNIVWLGQCISITGSGLTSFALGVWVFKRTGSAMQFALIGLFTVLPRVVLSPLAGAVVDRWDRRRAMILSDAGAAFSTAVLVLLLFANRLELWHIYLIAGVGAAFSTVQWPAYAAAITLLVPQDKLGRANGMIQLGQAAAEILSPVVAGVLVQFIRLEGVILIDFATFVFAVSTLLLVRFPQPHDRFAPKPEGGSLRQELAFGWKYILARQGLLGLLVFLAVVNFLWGMVGALVVPMVLGFASSDVLGIIISIAGAGMLAGSLAMSIWGGPRRRVAGMLYFEFLSGICFLLMGFRPSFWLVAIGAFGAHTTIAIVYGSNQAIWQSKVEPDVQGRVFAAQQMITRATSPFAYVLAGLLADNLFGPLLSAGGSLATTVGQVIGTGPGRGIGLLFIMMGIAKMAVVFWSYTSSRVRHVEDELPNVSADISALLPS